jgi:hypothetical protein
MVAGSTPPTSSDRLAIIPASQINWKDLLIGCPHLMSINSAIQVEITDVQSDLLLMEQFRSMSLLKFNKPLFEAVP